MYKSLMAGSTPLDDLSPLAKRYAEQWVLCVGTSKSNAEIARAAGCKSKSAQGLRQRAHVLHTRTEEARTWLVERLIRTPENGALGIGQIKHLAQFGAPDSVKLAAASKLIELAGFQPQKISEIHHKVEHSLTTDQLKSRIAELFAQLSPEERAFIEQRSPLPAISADGASDIIDVKACSAQEPDASDQDINPQNAPGGPSE